MQNVPFMLLLIARRTSNTLLEAEYSVPSIAHTKENKTSHSYAKTNVYAGMMTNEIRKNTLLNFLTQILYLLCYIFHVR